MQRITLLVLFLFAQFVLAFAQPKSIYYSQPFEDYKPSFLFKDQQGDFVLSANRYVGTFEWTAYNAFYVRLSRYGKIVGEIPNTYGTVCTVNALSNQKYISLGKYLTSGQCHGIKYEYNPFK